MQLNKLNKKLLKQVISSANLELNRRKQVEQAAVEFQRLIKKYKLGKEDIKSLTASVQTTTVGSAARSDVARAKVKPKYKSKDGLNIWTGRGKSPKWVQEICHRDGLTIADFKADARFSI